MIADIVKEVEDSIDGRVQKEIGQVVADVTAQLRSEMVLSGLWDRQFEFLFRAKKIAKPWNN